jgi:hypothetical protein
MSSYVSRRADPKRWREHKRAEAQANHAKKLSAIRPDRHPTYHPYGTTWPNGTRVEITGGRHQTRQGVITRQHFAGVYVLLDMRPAEYSVKEELIIAPLVDPVREGGCGPLPLRRVTDTLV